MSKVTLTADQVIGKKLWATRPYEEKSYPESTQAIQRQPGLVGTVYSWIVRGKKVWWAFEYSPALVFYVLHNPDTFNQDTLLNQFTPEEQAAIREASKFDIPNWLTFGGAGFAFYQGSLTTKPQEKLAWRLGGFMLGAYGLTKVVGNVADKIDFNPFDDLLNSGG